MILTPPWERTIEIHCSDCGWRGVEDDCDIDVDMEIGRSPVQTTYCPECHSSDTFEPDPDDEPDECRVPF